MGKNLTEPVTKEPIKLTELEHDGLLLNEIQKSRIKLNGQEREGSWLSKFQKRRMKLNRQQWQANLLIQCQNSWITLKALEPQGRNRTMFKRAESNWKDKNGKKPLTKELNQSELTRM